MLEDGTYDAIVVDAAATGDGGLHLEVTILAGRHKGEVVSLRAVGLGVDELAVLGTPATLTVRDGQPAVVLEP
jgi:anion-transporting  ArsA/GET3 family ATPase